MQLYLNKPILAAASLALVLLTTGAEAVPYTAGDLIVGFHATNSTNGPGTDQTYLLNIGQASLYRDASVGFTLANTIGDDLGAIFGGGWFSRPDLLWGFAGTPSNSNPITNPPLVNGDPTRTVYASRVEPSLGVQSTPWDLSASGGFRAAASNTMTAMQNAFLAAPANGATTPGAAKIPVAEANTNDWTEFNPPTSPDNVSFQAFNPTIEGDFAMTTPKALDLYRILNSNQAGVVEPGTVGIGQYQGTFTISSLGAIAFAVPEPSSVALLGFTAVLGLMNRRHRRCSNQATHS